MRDLNHINEAVKSTRYIFTISLIIPIFMGFGAWALANGAAPSLPLHDNFLEIFGLGIIASALLALPIPYIFKWNWESKYFGAGLLPFASGSILGIYPILCIALHSSLPAAISLALILVEVILIYRWCFRFIKIYRRIYLNKDLFHYIYSEESSAVYYLQQADNKVINKIFKFDQFPNSKLCILSLLAAFSLTPFATPLSKFAELPFIHIFLAIASTPLNLMFLGLSTKIWLVYYFYPMKIKKETNKPVYVDISSHPSKSLADAKPYQSFRRRIDK